MKRVVLIAVLVIGVAGCGDDDNAPPAPTATDTPTATATPTPTDTRTSTPSVTDTPSDTHTPTATRTITLTPSVTPTLGPGANIGFIGILRADNTLVDPAGTDAEGRVVFERPTGSGFVIVVEAERGTNNRIPGELSYNPEGPPDFQIEANKPLGNGSATVCDNMLPDFGGVPGIDPPDFSDVPSITDVLNDFGCRFTNGAGEPIGRHPPNEGCVLFTDGEYGFVNSETDVQFCGTVTRPMLFETGNTVLTARVLDASGLPGPERQIVIRVLAP